MDRVYDVIVVGGGHAGCEAALASARMGADTLLLTMNLDLIAQMPCNPGIGGPAKGHVVQEIDALGGEMGRNTDRTFIQIRMLNQSRGPAVQALRAQCDKRLYSLAMKHVLEQTPNLDVAQASVEQLTVTGQRVTGVVSNVGRPYRGRSVILTTGTFLDGRVLTGQQAVSAGRAGEFAAIGLSASLRQLGFRLERLQTNTPPRVDARTIDFALTEPQSGSDVPLYFSLDSRTESDPLIVNARAWLNSAYPHASTSGWRVQLPCYMVRTNDTTLRIIRQNLNLSPISSGLIQAAGPRYCPSIEEKAVRFPDKTEHQLFLEPEGFATNEVYVQGFFTGLPESVQYEMLHSIPALREARITRPGYAIEYDFVPPSQIDSTLETRRIEGLYHAGQINGTSGYEEAAAQGLLAGINAARKLQGQDAIVLRRDQAYIGVLIDDIVTKEVAEPYRLLTSRAEYRLLLRADNADVRLRPLAAQLGLVDNEQAEAVHAREALVAAEMDRLANTWLPPSQAVNAVLADAGMEPLARDVNALQLLKRPGAEYRVIAALCPRDTPLPTEAARRVMIEAHYEGYIRKQQLEIERHRRLENWFIPTDLDYRTIRGLRAEAGEKLNTYRPRTVGQAQRIQGVTPADISVLLIHLQGMGRSAE